MRVLAKSLLDLIPLAVVTIIISLIASQSLEELSVNYNEIITEDLSVVSRLNDAGKAIDNWKSSINEGILNSSENPDVATQNFEKLLTEKNSLLKALATCASPPVSNCIPTTVTDSAILFIFLI